jgi:hypothetical protein
MSIASLLAFVIFLGVPLVVGARVGRFMLRRKSKLYKAAIVAGLLTLVLILSIWGLFFMLLGPGWGTMFAATGIVVILKISVFALPVLILLQGLFLWIDQRRIHKSAQQPKQP